MTDTTAKIAELLAGTARALADADGAPVSPVYVFAAANELVLLTGRVRDQMMQPVAPASPAPVIEPPATEVPAAAEPVAPTAAGAGPAPVTAEATP